MARTPKSRAALLEAAETVFTREGLAGARTEEIARLAGANKAMVHYYFDTKEKLYEAVLHRFLSQFREQVLEPIKSGATPTDSLFIYVDGHMEFLVRHPNFPRLVQREMMTGGPRMRHLIEHFQGPLSRALRKVLRAGIRCGEFRKVDVDNMLLSIGSVTAFHFIIAPVIKILLRIDSFNRKLVARRKAAVFDLLGHGLLTGKGRKLAAGWKGKRR